MKYDFDAVIPRHGTDSLKWDALGRLFDDKDLLPLWVADMDFAAPPPVVDALNKRAGHGVFGYTVCLPRYYDAVIRWMERRHGWAVDPRWIVFSPGVVPALNLLVECLTEPGDGVIVQQPVYYPFMAAARDHGRRLLNNPLVLDGGRYRMDFDGLARLAKGQGARLMILCSPHNPVGRVWGREELRRLGDICLSGGITVIADEIHHDLVYPGLNHLPFASLSAEFLENAVTCTAPSKTFNLAGLQASNIIIADKKKRRAFRAALDKYGLSLPGSFAVTAVEAAYLHGGQWLDALMEYLAGNLAFLNGFIALELPEIKVIQPEATYLVWLDCRALGMDRDGLRGFMRQKARLALDDGFIFGSPEGDGFQRINIACPRAVLAESLGRMAKAVRGR